MSRGIELTPDLLATQGRALRGLASSLLGDAHAAEDVVQETWLACLKHPGALPERVSAWLGTVTKHLALHRLRGEGRRELRERQAAAPERLEALQQRTLEREEALRAVTQALLALEEPYKTTLFLRFYEDLSPSAIAEELGLPPSTVKSRIARGLERLRARLGAEFKGDELRQRRALLALAGASAPGVAVTTTTTVAGASALATVLPLAKLAAAASVILAGGTLWWWQRPAEQRGESGRSAEPRTQLVATAAASGSPAVSADDPAVAAGSGVKREAVASETREPKEETIETFPAEASFPYRITGLVRDELDLPLAGAHVFLGPHGFPLNRVAETDGEGRFTFEFDARKASFDCAFDVDDGGGRMLGLQELHLVSGRELVVDVGLNPISSRGSPLVEMRGTEVAISELVRGAQTETKVVYDFAGAREDVVAQAAGVLSSRLKFAQRSIGPLERAPECAHRSDGRGVFVDPPPSMACARPVDYELFSDAIGFDAGSDQFPAEGAYLDLYKVDLDLEVSAFQKGAPPAQATIHGIVRDASGIGVPNAAVRWAKPGQPFEGSVSTGADGSFTLPGILAGDVVLRAGGGDLGIARERVTLSPDQDLAWNPLLARGDEVTGRVCLFNGQMPLARVLVELWSTSPSNLWCDATLTNEDGRFALPNVPPGELALHVYASGAMNPPSAFPIRIVRPVLANTDLGDILLTKDEVVSTSLAVRALDSAGRPIPGAEVRVWQASTGRGAFAAEPDEDGKLALAGLPAGSYRVEVGSPFGWRDLGRIWIDPWAGGGVDLGQVCFPAPGLAVLSAESTVPDARAVQAILWSTHPDVLARVDGRKLGHEVLALRPGVYVLSAAAGRERRGEASLEVKPGLVSALTLEVSASKEILARPDEPDGELVAGAKDASCNACHAKTAADGFAGAIR